uniref:Glycosyltransferase n=1 Tax=Rubia yunnanensis TaxID=1650721 RepID=A0A896ARU0_9GENT|nr:glycosyltransferase [Rubia yunnanensis]
MASSNSITLQMVAIPYPGRGHINQMLNFCKSIAHKTPDFLITFILTEEWLGSLSAELDHGSASNIRFATIPDVLPSHKDRAKDMIGFIEAVFTKMEGPVERLLDRLEPPEPRVIVYDMFMKWVLGVARRRGVAAASFWPMSATFFTVLFYLESLRHNGQLAANPLDDEDGERRLTCIPGISSIRIADVPKLDGKSQIATEIHRVYSFATKPDYILIPSLYELESEAIDNLKNEIPTPIYTIGLTVPPVRAIHGDTNDHFSWLNAQPRASVLYISQGSFLSASDDQLDEFVAGIRDSGIRFFLVVTAKENCERFRERIGGGGNGLVVEWCDQLRVLLHPSVGGFWSHCGWNSTKEAALSGLPVLTCPIIFDQIVNSKQIVEDWRIGWRLKSSNGGLVKRDEISSVLKRFMDSECGKVGEMRRKAVEISEICRKAGSEFGSAELQIEAFIKDIAN